MHIVHIRSRPFFSLCVFSSCVLFYLFIFYVLLGGMGGVEGLENFLSVGRLALPWLGMDLSVHALYRAS